MELENMPEEKPEKKILMKRKVVYGSATVVLATLATVLGPKFTDDYRILVIGIFAVGVSIIGGHTLTDVAHLAMKLVEKYLGKK